MRGAHIARVPEMIAMRIIPADAGSTSRNRVCLSRNWDHPRGCGEHITWLMGVPARLGSSPRMRGAPGPCMRISAAWGIIPADAGSTQAKAGESLVETDHPRGCGEHTPLLR